MGSNKINCLEEYIANIQAKIYLEYAKGNRSNLNSYEIFNRMENVTIGFPFCNYAPQGCCPGPQGIFNTTQPYMNDYSSYGGTTGSSSQGTNSTYSSYGGTTGSSSQREYSTSSSYEPGPNSTYSSYGGTTGSSSQGTNSTYSSYRGSTGLTSHGGNA